MTRKAKEMVSHVRLSSLTLSCGDFLSSCFISFPHICDPSFVKLAIFVWQDDGHKCHRSSFLHQWSVHCDWVKERRRDRFLVARANKSYPVSTTKREITCRKVSHDTSVSVQNMATCSLACGRPVMFIAAVRQVGAIFTRILQDGEEEGERERGRRKEH